MGRFTGSVRDYFHDNSNGVFNPQFRIVGPVTINYSQYAANKTDNAREIVTAALDAADSQVNYADYDGNGDSQVDMVYFIFAGCGSNHGGNDERLIWPHAGHLIYQKADDDKWYYLQRDNINMGRYACSTEMAGAETNSYLDGIGTICHEFSHVLGLKDLYDTDYGKNGQSNHPDDWTLMASGGYLNNSRTPAGYGLYERYAVGFATPQTLGAEGCFSLQPIGTSNRGYRINSAVENEFFLVENRQQTSKWDAHLPGHGLLVFRVDSTDTEVWNSNKANIDPTHNYYEMVRAGGGRGATDTDPFPGTQGVTALTNTTLPANLLSWTGQPTKMVLENITESANGTVTFDLTDSSKQPVTPPDGPDDPDTPDPITFGSYAVKYWYDNQTQLAGTISDVRSAFQLDVSGLADGLHALHVAVCGTSDQGDYYEEAPHTVYFEKHGEETQIRNRFFVDNVETIAVRYSTDNTYTLALPVETVSEGLHKLTTMIETTESQRPVIVSHYFQRMPTSRELDDLHLMVSIDAAAPTVLQRPFVGDSLVYDLDVSKMDPGLHTLTYQVKGRLQTAPEKTFFVIDPKMNGYDYWLNDDRSTAVHTALTPVAMPYELSANVPVRTMPLRPEKFHFAVEEGIPTTYAINDFTFQATTNNGYWDYLTAEYIDTQSRTYIGATPLPKNQTTTANAPAANAIGWFSLKANAGDGIGLYANRPCTLQLFSPRSAEVYRASGQQAVTEGGITAPVSGTYYVALHSLTDASAATVAVTYDSVEGAGLIGDVNNDGTVGIGDIVAVTNIMAGINTDAATMSRADVNGDGDIGIGDIVAITNIMAGLN